MPIFFTFPYSIVNFVGINSLILSPTRPFSFVLLQIASAYFQDHINSAAAIDVQRYSLATIFQHVHLPCCRCAPAQRRSSASLDSSVPHSDGHPNTQAVAVQSALLLQAGFHRSFSAALSDTPVQAFAAGKHVLHEPVSSHASASSIHLPVGPKRLYGFFSVFPLFQADADMPSMPSCHQTTLCTPRPVPADTSRFFKRSFQTFFGIMQQIHRTGIPLIQETFAAKDLRINERVPQFTDNIFQRTVFHIHTIIEGRCGQCNLMLQNIHPHDR